MSGIIEKVNNRFEIRYTVDHGFKKNGKDIKGMNGYQGRFINFIAWILEKIFHKTVAVELDNKTFYFHCKSVVKLLKRLENQPGLEKTKIIDELAAKNLTDKELEKLSHEGPWLAKLFKEMMEQNKHQYEVNIKTQVAEAAKNQDIDAVFRLGAVEEKAAKYHLKEMLHKEIFGNCEFKKCRELIEKGADVGSHLIDVCGVNQVRSNPANALAMCALLLEKGADINKSNDKGIFPLEAAIMSQHAEIVEWFVKHGANREQKTKENKTFVQLAKENNYPDNIIELLTNGPKESIPQQSREEIEKFNKANEENLVNKERLNRELNYAADKRDVKTCEKLIAQGGDKSIWQRRLNDDLWSAVSKGDIKSAEIAIQKGGEVNPSVYSVSTPLIQTIFEKHANRDAMFAFLLKNGCDLNQRNRLDLLPLEAAISRKDDKLIDWLLKNGADKSLKTSKDKTLEALAREEQLSDDLIERLKVNP